MQFSMNRGLPQYQCRRRSSEAPAYHCSIWEAGAETGPWDQFSGFCLRTAQHGHALLCLFRTWRAAGSVWIPSWTGTDMRGRSASREFWMKMKTPKILSTAAATPSSRMQAPRRRKVGKRKGRFLLLPFSQEVFGLGSKVQICAQILDSTQCDPRDSSQPVR